MLTPDELAVIEQRHLDALRHGSKRSDLARLLQEVKRLRAGIERIGARAENWSSVDVQCAAADLLGVDASEFDYKEEE